MSASLLACSNLTPPLVAQVPRHRLRSVRRGRVGKWREPGVVHHRHTGGDSRVGCHHHNRKHWCHRLNEQRGHLFGARSWQTVRAGGAQVWTHPWSLGLWSRVWARYGFVLSAANEYRPLVYGDTSQRSEVVFAGGEPDQPFIDSIEVASFDNTTTTLRVRWADVAPHGSPVLGCVGRWRAALVPLDLPPCKRSPEPAVRVVDHAGTRSLCITRATPVVRGRSM